MTKEIENTIFQRIKIYQTNQLTISEMFHGGPWFPESSFLEMKGREWGIKMHSIYYISPGHMGNLVYHRPHQTFLYLLGTSFLKPQ